jgi:hypothetical protein
MSICEVVALWDYANGTHALIDSREGLTAVIITPAGNYICQTCQINQSSHAPWRGARRDLCRHLQAAGDQLHYGNPGTTKPPTTQDTGGTL